MKESNTTHLIDRGFTGHQHLDVFELINMNGRMFDPVVQQFLSPDPYVQMPDNPLNFNRYAYALFNPLYWTDPTGMLINPIFDWEGNYLGTDSKGLRGEAIIMNVADFKPGMSHDEALRKGTLRSELPMMIHPDVLNMIDNQMSLIESFNNRPLASGMTEFSPINVEDITLIGPTVKGLISLASWTGKKIFGTSVTKGGGSWATTSGILRDAVKGKGNYGLGTGTFEEAIQAGRSWVGEGFTISKDASSWISSNGLRQFRPPSFKPKLGIEQANFQWRNINKGAWQSNGHLNIIKP
jgi:RHS repeat-associated protein